MKKVPLKTNQNHPQIRSYTQAVQRGQESQHVLPRDSSWVVKRAGAQRATQVFETQKDARVFAEAVAKNQGTSLFVHGRDGRIRARKDF